MNKHELAGVVSMDDNPELEAIFFEGQECRKVELHAYDTEYEPKISCAFGEERTIVASFTGNKPDSRVRISHMYFQPVADLPLRCFKEKMGVLTLNEVICKLQARYIRTAYDFTKLPQEAVQKMMGITGVRTWKELQEQIANFASTMAEKLRKQHSVTNEIAVFAYTNRFKEDQPQAHANALVSFNTPISDQRTIIASTVQATKELFKKGYGFKKAGVIATDIMDQGSMMHSLFEDTEALEKEHRITSALDAINSAFGDGAIKLAVQGSGRIHSGTFKCAK